MRRRHLEPLGAGGRGISRWHYRKATQGAWPHNVPVWSLRRPAAEVWPLWAAAFRVCGISLDTAGFFRVGSTTRLIPDLAYVGSTSNGR